MSTEFTILKTTTKLKEEIEEKNLRKEKNRLDLSFDGELECDFK